ncbi:MAG: hypothetical protein OXD31_09635, partial [Chloroflexi bacterium]|nr:hypothetical protein [Chloroflexota bacterium]
ALQRLTRTTVDIPDAIAPRVRGTIDVVATTTRERTTFVTLLAAVGIGSLAVFVYLLLRRRQ